ncbi:MAG: nucleoside triphosphate pyrophosphatase [Acutalibacteraceae bacterium]
MNSENVNVVLASNSPRRKELIKLICESFTVCPADCEEALPDGIGGREAAEYLSKIKNEASRLLCKKSDLVISADTVVATETGILGKPKDKDDARRMITALSGKKHFVYTGVTISKDGRFHTFSEATEVEFFSLTNEEVEEYISTSEPYDKAGGYGIQGLGGLLVKGINGDYCNVVGLPIARLKREIDLFLV